MSFYYWTTEEELKRIGAELQAGDAKLEGEALRRKAQEKAMERSERRVHSFNDQLFIEVPAGTPREESERLFKHLQQHYPNIHPSQNYLETRHALVLSDIPAELRETILERLKSKAEIQNIKPFSLSAHIGPAIGNMLNKAKNTDKTDWVFTDLTPNSINMHEPAAPLIKGVAEISAETGVDFSSDKVEVSELSDGRIVVSGMRTNRDVAEMQRMLLTHVGGGAVQKHAAHTAYGTHFVRGFAIQQDGKQHENIFKDIEASGWANGQVNDNYAHLPPHKRVISKVLERASFLAPMAYGVSDSMVFVSIFIDARRRGISVFKHEGFPEAAGFLFGTFSWLAESLANLSQPIRHVVGKAFGRFKVGEGYDFGISSEEPKHGSVPDAALRGISQGGRFMMMLANIWAGWGLLKAMNGKVIATEEVDGFRNVVIDEKSGDIVRANRFKIQNVFSGVVLMISAAMFAFFPKRGSDRTPFDFPAIVDGVRETPVIGTGIKMLDGFLEKTSLGQQISDNYGKLWAAVSADSFKFFGDSIMAHNLGQIGFNVAALPGLRAEVKELQAQAEKVRGILAKGELPPGKNGVPDFTPAEKKQALAVLKQIYSAEIPRNNTGPRYEEGTKEYHEAVKNPQNFMDFINRYKEIKADRSITISPLENYIFQQAQNLKLLQETRQEIDSASARNMAYSILFLNSRLLTESNAGMGVNPAAGVPSLLAVCHDAAQRLTEQGIKPTDDRQILNLAEELSKMKPIKQAAHESGGKLSADSNVIADYITCYMKGETPAVEHELLESVLAAQAKPPALITISSPAE